MNHIDVELTPAVSGLITATEACSRHAGMNWSVDVLTAFFGFAFEASYGPGGLEVWEGGGLEWYHFGRGFGRLGVRSEGVELIGNNPSIMPRPSDAEWAQALQRTREIVAASVERRVPVLAWRPTSVEQAERGDGAHGWAMITGFDAERDTYQSLRPDGYLYEVGASLIGRSDPVHWLTLAAYLGPDPAADPAAAARSAIADGVALGSGELRAADGPDAARIAEGLEAVRAWAGETPTSRRGQAGRWGRGRRAAAGFCDWAATVLPEKAEALGAAKAAYVRLADGFEAFAGGTGDAEAAADLAEQSAAAHALLEGCA